MTDLPPGFVATTIPARFADLGCTFVRPHDWVLVDLPQEDTDFDQVHALAPVVVAMAPFAAILFAVSARPAYAHGAVGDWLAWLAQHHGMNPGPIELEPDMPHPAAACWGVQQAGDTAVRVRAQMFEDGGRLVQVGVMAPEALWDSVHDTLRTMLRSFRLAAPRGSTFELPPAGQSAGPSTYGSLADLRRAAAAPPVA